MSKKAKKNTLEFIRNVVPDMPDSRDWFYGPTLQALPYPALTPPAALKILNQGQEGSCTGFALAAVINYLMERSQRTGVRVSARMLYRLAQLHDEWPGEDYEGSSIKGAILGWANMGVCQEDLWPSDDRHKNEELTIQRAKDARHHTIGAYYRLEPKIEHFHAALSETGALYVSAQTHAGWNSPMNGVIEFKSGSSGGHAFAIVGYDQDGFIIQNSWGTGWGKKGLAHWTYADWNENLMDAWVIQLAYPTPEIFGLEPRAARIAAGRIERKTLFAPKRIHIAGHFVHVDDGKFHQTGRYWSNAQDTQQTAGHVAQSTKYKHLLLYAHGGLNSPEDSARRIHAMKEVFKANGIYPYHLMYDVGLGEEIMDLLIREFNPLNERSSGMLDDIFDLGRKAVDFASERKRRLIETLDQKIEDLVRKPVTPIWEEMKRGARKAFDDDGDGTSTLKMFVEAFSRAQKEKGKAGITQVHMAGHSTGAVALAHLLAMTRRLNIQFPVSTLSLLAPACTFDLFSETYLPILKGADDGANIGKMIVYCLNKQAELDDNVGEIYRKSLLYLVSNAFEREAEKPLLGMEKFKRLRPRTQRNLKFIVADPTSQYSRSESHDGFDNDERTMNNLLKNILGHAPDRPFTKKDLNYGKIIF
ncbi:C1 family peptidase [Candidatus Sumerlaeota bacterium]|nr:C1 family peptidase [Candidatus Sumerlaeota bacterium]